ncbi:MAG: SpoIIE family protein phosphatase [Calditrichia bacterium]
MAERTRQNGQEIWYKPDARETLQFVLDSLAEGVIVADREGKFLFFNPVAEKILGIGLQDIDPSEWTATYGCYYPDGKTPYPAHLLPLALAIQGQETLDEVIFIKNPARSEGVFISVSASPLRDSNGSVKGGTVIFRDITDDMRNETARQQSDERLKAQFMGFPIPTYVWQHMGRDFFLIDFNDAALAFTGNSIKKYMGIRLSKMYRREPEIKQDFWRCFREKTRISREMSYRLQSNGDTKDLVVNYVYLPPDLVMVVTEDITDRRKTQQSLLKLSGAVEQTADGVVITDREGIIEYVNPAFEKTTGYRSHEVIGLTPRILNSGRHNKKFYDQMWKIILRGRPYRGRLMNRKKNGQIFWCQETITPMTDEKGEILHFVSVLKDITGQMAQEEQKVRMSVAREIQQRLFRDSLEVPGFEIAGANHSADETSGDYFDFFLTPDGYIEMVVGDVSGHGIGPALIMTQTRAYLRAFAKMNSDPGTILNRLNRELAVDLDGANFVTLILARLDPASGLLEYAGAGHVPAFVLGPTGKAKHIMNSMGIPLGFIEEYSYVTSRPVKTGPDDILVFFSDGVTEARSAHGNEFGIDRALEIILKQRQDPARRIVNHLHQAVLKFSNYQLQKDDVTSVICKVKALPPPE